MTTQPSGTAVSMHTNCARMPKKKNSLRCELQSITCISSFEHRPKGMRQILPLKASLAISQAGYLKGNETKRKEDDEANETNEKKNQNAQHTQTHINCIGCKPNRKRCWWIARFQLTNQPRTRNKKLTATAIAIYILWDINEREMKSDTILSIHRCMAMNDDGCTAVMQCAVFVHLIARLPFEWEVYSYDQMRLCYGKIVPMKSKPPSRITTQTTNIRINYGKINKMWLYPWWMLWLIRVWLECRVYIHIILFFFPVFNHRSHYHYHPMQSND